MAGRAEKSTIPAKGDRGLSEFGIARSYSEAQSNDKAGISGGGAGGAGLAGISTNETDRPALVMALAEAGIDR